MAHVPMNRHLLGTIRLGVDSVSFYLSHAPDPETLIEQTLEGFAAGIESKKVRHIGCCNVDGDQLRTALEASDRLGLPAFEWVQNGFSLLSPKAYDEVRNICTERNLGFTPFSPLAGGFLPENIGGVNLSRQSRGWRCTREESTGYLPMRFSTPLIDSGPRQAGVASALPDWHSLGCWPTLNARRP